MNIDLAAPVKYVLDSGADDTAFDVLLLTGPVLIGGLAHLGRSILTVTLAVGYLCLFVGNIAHNWMATTKNKGEAKDG